MMNISFALELYKKAEKAIPSLRRLELDLKRRVFRNSYSASIDDVLFGIVIDVDQAVIGKMKERIASGCIFFDENGNSRQSQSTFEVYIYRLL